MFICSEWKTYFFPCEESEAGTILCKKFYNYLYQIFLPFPFVVGTRQKSNPKKCALVNDFFCAAAPPR